MLRKESIVRLTAQLALPATGHEQDWDVELADPKRIGDFLAVQEDSSLSQDDRRALMALLLASVDAYVGTEGRLPGEWEQIVRQLYKEEELHRPTLSYWRCDGDDGPEGWFHLTPYVRELRTIQ